MAEKKENEASVLPPVMSEEKAARKKLKEDRKALKKELKEQKKAAKQREAELEERRAELNGDDGGGVATLVVTLFIIIIWIIIMILLIKLDVGGFGSNILAPIIGDVPGINRILPEGSYTVETQQQPVTEGSTEPAYDEELVNSLDEANIYIKRLEDELRKEMEENADLQEQVEKLQTEVTRLEPFEEEQAQFEQEKEDFYKNVVYADNAPDPTTYQQYYEMIEPDVAAQIYAQILQDQADDAELDDYVKAYSSMKAKEAASIFDEMVKNDTNGDSVRLVSKILAKMSAENRGAILDKMTEEYSSKVTEYMEPSTHTATVSGLTGN